MYFKGNKYICLFPSGSRPVGVFWISYIDILPCLWKLLRDISDHRKQSIRIALGKPSREWLAFHFIMWITYFGYLSFLDIFPKGMTVFNARKLFSLKEAKVTPLMKRNFTLCASTRFRNLVLEWTLSVSLEWQWIYWSASFWDTNRSRGLEWALFINYMGPGSLKSPLFPWNSIYNVVYVYLF